jgi:O-antigen/teichoic acid export membrane protein
MVSGVLWTLAMSVVGQGSTFLGAVLAARLLGSEDFGKLGMIQSIVLMLAGFAGLGMGTTATKFVAELRDSEPERAGRILGLCGLITTLTGVAYAAGLVLLAPWIAGSVLHVPTLTDTLRLGAIYVLFCTLNAYQIGALVGFEAFSRLARVNMALGPATLATTFIFTWLLGLPGTVLALGVGMACSWTVHQFALRRECQNHGVRIRCPSPRHEFPLLCNFVLPAALSGCVGGLALTACNALLVRQCGTFAQIALFNAAYTIRTLVLLAPNMVSRVSAPLLCNLRVADEASAYRRTFWACLWFNGALTGAFAVLLFAAGPQLLAVFGKDFTGGRLILGLLLASAAAEAIATVLFQPLYGHGKIWTHLAINICWSGLLVGGAWWGVDRGGAAAVAAAHLAAWTSAALIYGVVARRLFRQENTRSMAGVASAPSLMSSEAA